ncbi:hypothetical protein M407DRAFT_169351 [Tulasnella calospora MUT 4182]|uniref:Uncharacterized protein n=1 Tax=Tulasnella calospora MUT 4182 TaxID=1051891 RepID=A0A0C3PSE3_9AGAM|nr:hypothetical protein M407DRAFT_169351 [Tulasnella calospora MUT 4182]
MLDASLTPCKCILNPLRPSTSLPRMTRIRKRSPSPWTDLLNDLFVGLLLMISPSEFSIAPSSGIF